MGLIILATIPALLIFIHFVVDGIRFDDLWDFLKGGSLISLIVMVIIWAPIHLIFGWIPETKWEVSEETPIMALKDGTKGSGTFYLGTGTKEDRMVYYYMTEEDFGNRMDYEYSSSTHVKEVKNNGKNKPRIIKYEKVFKSSFAEFFFPTPVSFERTKTQIVVPKGTITDEFKIDME